MAKDVIPGGLADNMPDSNFDKAELRQGMRVESEHTSSKSVAKEIAKDHLMENSKYYDELAKIEKKAFWKSFEKHANVFKSLGQALEKAKPQKLLSGAQHTAKITAIKAERAAMKASGSKPAISSAANSFISSAPQSAAKQVNKAGESARVTHQRSQMASPSMFRKALEN